MGSKRKHPIQRPGRSQRRGADSPGSATGRHLNLEWVR